VISRSSDCGGEDAARSSSGATCSSSASANSSWHWPLNRVARRRLFILRHDDLLDVTGNATAGSRAVGGDCRICLKKSRQLFRLPDLRLDKFLRKHLARPLRLERKGVKKRCLSP
jgi:hypothetical protein